jgi:transcriptional antiterminator NusG
MEITSGDNRWYAVRVRSTHEKNIAATLDQMRYEQFLPLYRAQREWSDRVKDVDLPLFSGYIFCRLDIRQRLPLLKIPGVLQFVGAGKSPMPVEDAEIETLKIIARAGLPCAPWPFLRAGQTVRIERGVLKGVEGVLMEVKNRFRLIVSVTLLQRSVAAELDRDSVAPISPRKEPGTSGTLAGGWQHSIAS